MPSKKRKATTTTSTVAAPDTTVLVSVEELINIAMGPAETNTVNFKTLQMVLHILARQMRLLGTKCDIKLDDRDPDSDAEPETEATQAEDKDTDKKHKGKKKKEGKDTKTAKEAPGSETSIVITETEQQNEKVLVVEKGEPSSRTGQGSGIEVVSLSKFNLLQAQVEALRNSTGPLPMPAMPDDNKLKADLVKGSATLTDTMQAMQLAARVQASEKGLAMMANLLTQLATAGALPEGFLEQIQKARIDVKALRGDLKTGLAGDLPQKSVVIDAPAAKSEHTTRPSSASVQPSTAGLRSSPRVIPVTHTEMANAFKSLKDELLKTMQQVTSRAATTADNASIISRSVAEKMEVAMSLNKRITNLHGLATDYADQLTGFDAGLSTQMQTFNEQMLLMRDEMKGGLVQLKAASNNAETVAVLELTERYEGLQAELEESSTEHGRLNSKQKQLAQELLGLTAAVEMLREQKADRDEVWDGLRDKADITKLDGLLTEAEFVASVAELDKRLAICYEKFERQESVWMLAMKDLADIVEQKATIMQILSLKQLAQDQLNEMLNWIKKLEIELGVPKAAILTRLLSKDGTCAGCKAPALMEQADMVSGKPPRLPALRPAPAEVCVPPVAPIVIKDEDTKSHMCQRWVGGSHTLVSRSMPREVATKQLVHDQPVKKYMGLGVDGKLYNMEEELQPCLECNLLSTDEVKGAGDAEEIKICSCWPGVTDPADEKEKDRPYEDLQVDNKIFT